MRITNRASALLRRARAAVGGVLVAALLLPMPAMAITYLGSWSATYSQSGSPLPPKATFTDAVSCQNDTLLVDQPDYTPSKATQAAKSTITLTRQVSLSSMQQIDFDHIFAGLFSQGGYSDTLTVKNSQGQTVLAFNETRTTGSSSFQELQDSLSINDTLRNGTYTLVATVPR